MIGKILNSFKSSVFSEFYNSFKGDTCNRREPMKSQQQAKRIKPFSAKIKS